MILHTRMGKETLMKGIWLLLIVFAFLTCTTLPEKRDTIEGLLAIKTAQLPERTISRLEEMPNDWSSRNPVVVLVVELKAEEDGIAASKLILNRANRIFIFRLDEGTYYISDIYWKITYFWEEKVRELFEPEFLESIGFVDEEIVPLDDDKKSRICGEPLSLFAGTITVLPFQLFDGVMLSTEEEREILQKISRYSNADDWGL